MITLGIQNLVSKLVKISQKDMLFLFELFRTARRQTTINEASTPSILKWQTGLRLELRPNPRVYFPKVLRLFL